MRITVSGPAAAGKGTVARTYARMYRIPYVDAGLVFRFAALCVKRGWASSVQGINKLPWGYEWNGTDASLHLQGHVVPYADLLDSEIAQEASRISSVPEGFTALKVMAETAIRLYDDVIADGRSLGTAILPDADAKFYIDANVHIRAERRLKDLLANGAVTTLDEVLSDLQERDARDRSRSVDPLRIPDGATIFNSGVLSVQEMVLRMHKIVTRR